MKWNPRYFLLFLALVALEVLIALFVHDRIIRPYLGDVLVVLVLYCLARSVLKPHPLLPLAVFLLAGAVEVGQYFHLVDRLGIQNRVLRIALGSTFDPVDLLCYLCGAVLAGAVGRRDAP